MKLSACGRFVVIDLLHIDRRELESLTSWAAERGLRVQDAIQLAICAFNEGAADQRRHDTARGSASSARLRPKPLVD